MHAHAHHVPSLADLMKADFWTLGTGFHAHGDGQWHWHGQGHDNDHDHGHDHQLKLPVDDGMMREPSDTPFSTYNTFGSKWGNPAFGTPGGTVTWSLPGAGLADMSGSSFFTGLTVAYDSFLSFDWRQAIEAAFDAWAQVADIDFQYVADDTSGDIGVGNGAQIRIVAAYIDGDTGFDTLGQAFGPGNSAIAGDLVMDSSNTWTYDLFYLTMLHEIGHTLGLDHSGTTAIMSPTINTSLSGLTADDIAGIQAIYGTRDGSSGPTDDYAGDASTTGTAPANGSVTGNLETPGDRDWFAISMQAGVTYTIEMAGSGAGGGTASDPHLRLYDAGSLLVAQNDDANGTLDSSLEFQATQTGTYYVSAGHYADSGSGTYTITVSSQGGSTGPTAGSDDLTGTEGDDRIDLLAGFDTYRGRGGNDVVNGGADDDEIYGEDGNDTLNGGPGMDRMFGGAGNDVYVVDDRNDYVSESGGSGYDTVRAAVDFTLGAGIERLILTGTGTTSGTGNALGNAVFGNEAANELLGLAGNDVLRGFGGADRLNGGTGNDLMFGGTGDDVYVVDSLSDRAVEAAGNGRDLVISSVSHILDPAVENLVLTGTATINGQGNPQDNVLTGNAGSNGLYGRQGDDLLRGEDGDDFLFGGFGDDRIVGGLGNDLMRGDDGVDTFVFTWGQGVGTRDRVADFTDGVDRLDIVDLGAVNLPDATDDWTMATDSAVNTGGGVLITWWDGSEALLTGTTLAQLDDSDFIF